MRRKTAAILVFSLIASLFTGCGERTKDTNEIADLTSDGTISEQTSECGISSNSKDFESKLVSGTYYVVHDGVYYPLYSYGTNYDDAPGDWTEPSRQAYFTTENEINIPTLFEGDELVYYSTDGLLDYMIWERYYDLGYTIGLLNLQTMESGRVYLDLSDDDEVNIVPDSELYAMYDLGAEQILIDKIGGVKVDESLISDGLIVSTKKSKTYDLEVYTGTYYQHYTTTANTHAFKAYELYASIEYETLQEFLYRIEIPEYFVTGYYVLDGCGMVRIVRGDSYSEETDFNEQVLFPEIDETAWDYDPNEYVPPYMYSSYEPLNKFTTNQEGKLGYVPEEGTDTESEDLTENTGDIIFKEATVKEVELYFPEGKTCTVQIKSSTGETTGDITVIIGSSVKLVNYDRLAGIYEAEITGHGEKGTLKISGLTTNYDIALTNCEQYTNQLEVTSSEQEEISSEEAVNEDVEAGNEEVATEEVTTTDEEETRRRG